MIERVSPPGFLRRCTRCGHLACPCCQNWCDNLVPDHASVREADRERARTGVGKQSFTLDAADGEWAVEVFVVEGSVQCCGGECQYAEPLPEGFDAFMDEVYELGLHFLREGEDGRIIASDELPELKVEH